MDGPYTLVIIVVLAAAGIGATALFIRSRRVRKVTEDEQVVRDLLKPSARTPPTTISPSAHSPATAPGRAVESGPQLSRTTSDPVQIERLRQNLRIKFMHDEQKVESAIDFERERTPQATMEELLKAAIQRWERDNS